MATLIIDASIAAPQLTITNANILSVSTPLSSSIDGAEVAVDTSEAVVYADYNVNVGLFIPLGSDSLTDSNGDLFYCGVDEQILPQIPYGTKVTYYEDTMLIGVFYIDSVFRVAKQAYQLNLMSGLGLLETKVHKGNVYNGRPLTMVISDIIGGEFQWSMPPQIQSWPVYGWLPYDTARNNLHRVLLAMGVNIIKDSNGNPRFALLDSSNPTAVSDDEVYMSGSVSYGSPATQVNVTEHQFIEGGGEKVILFDNTDGSGPVTDAEVIFSEPMYNLEVNGLTLGNNSANYAIVSGVGTLKGIPYTHIQKVVTKTASPGSVKNREVPVTDVCLINPLNSGNVAQRLMDYYSAAQKINGRMILGTPRPGSAITVTDAFGDSKTGIISDMDITSSAVVAAQFAVVTDYTPAHQGNEYTGSEEITSSGTWTVPEGVTHIRVVLIGGGDGGDGGFDGTDGKGNLDMVSTQGTNSKTIDYDGAAEPGIGGEAGEAGEGGRIISADYDITPGEVLTISIGTGGAAGAANGGTGGAGTDTSVTSTTIGTLTTANGIRIPYGYKNLMTNSIYGQTGVDGTPGGDGGTSSLIDEYGSTRGRGNPGGAAGDTPGGDGGAGSARSTLVNAFGTASGGGGGGSAYNSQGGAGGYGLVSTPPDTSAQRVQGGDGGKGATAATPTNTTPGRGGDGGHGGGGGGNGGGAFVGGIDSSLVAIQGGSYGRHGDGTDGAPGGSGIVIILY